MSTHAPGAEPPAQPSLSPIMDTGLACLIMLARFHNLAASAEQLSHEFSVDKQVFAQAELLLAARKLGLKAKVVRTSLTRLGSTPLPAIAIDREGRFLLSPGLIRARLLSKIRVLNERKSLATKRCKHDGMVN